MEKPAILAVDDEPSVLAVVGRDLRKRYGADYDVRRASSGAEALETLEALRLEGRDVALILADQRMPQMTGVDRKMDLFKVLNAIGPAGNVSAGDKVKIVTDK